MADYLRRPARELHRDLTAMGVSLAAVQGALVASGRPDQLTPKVRSQLWRLRHLLYEQLTAPGQALAQYDGTLLPVLTELAEQAGAAFACYATMRELHIVDNSVACVPDQRDGAQGAGQSPANSAPARGDSQ